MAASASSLSEIEEQHDSRVQANPLIERRIWPRFDLAAGRTPTGRKSWQFTAFSAENASRPCKIENHEI